MIYDVIVIGGGVIGTSIAYQSAKKGKKVIIIEKGSIANTGGASAASAGGLRENDRDPREMPLAQASLTMWADLESELDADLEYVNSGQLMLFDKSITDNQIMKITERNKKFLIDYHQLDRENLLQKVPALSTEFQKGIFYKNGGHANPVLATIAFAEAARRLGVKIQRGTTVKKIMLTPGEKSVTGVLTDKGDFSAEVVVNAAGAWSSKIHETIGTPLPITTRAPQMSATLPAPQFLGPVISILGRKLSLKQTIDGRLRAGGGYSSNPGKDEFSATFSKESLDSQRQQVLSVLPKAVDSPVDYTYYGVEAECEDGVPILGAVPNIGGYFLATGFSGHGFTLAPGIGVAMSELISGSAPSISINGLGFERFLDASYAQAFEGRIYPG